MELTFETDDIRDATMDKNVARRVMAQDKAEFLFSLVADLKDAMFVGELADDPQVMQTNRGMRLRYPFASGYDLELEPIMGRPAEDGLWREAHRVKLLHILHDGAVLI